VDPKRVIASFVRRARWRAVWSAGVVATVFALAVALAAWWLAWRVVPAHAHLVAWIGALLVLVLVLAEARRARLSIAHLDAAASAGDALLTYWPQRAAPADGMLGWLVRDLAARLHARPVPSARRRATRTARRLLALLPLLLVLLLLCWLLPLGLGEGSRAGLGGAPAPGAQQDRPGRGAQAGNEDAPGAEPTLAPAPAPATPPQEPQPDGGEAGEPEPARPVQLPVREEFVVPSFVGAGESRLAKARTAEEEVSLAPAPPVSPQGVGAPPPVPPEQEFARAAERAAHARHVPAAERPIVQRYFKALAERR
jgi:hypothetical protein